MQKNTNSSNKTDTRSKNRTNTRINNRTNTRSTNGTSKSSKKSKNYKQKISPLKLREESLNKIENEEKNVNTQIFFVCFKYHSPSF